MRLLDELRAEHDLIERVFGALRAFVAARLAGGGDPADGARFIAFFRRYAGNFHHAREEDTLFAALVERARLPRSGPIDTLVADHHRLAALLAELETVIGLDRLDPDDGRRLGAAAAAYAESLGHHIDAENSVLFPECEPRLRRSGIGELPSRAMTPEEHAARLVGEALVQRYPPVDDPSVIRGDGCVCCPAFAEGCRGLEHEWWNEWEWAEFEEHLADG